MAPTATDPVTTRATTATTHGRQRAAAINPERRKHEHPISISTRSFWSSFWSFFSSTFSRSYIFMAVVNVNNVLGQFDDAACAGKASVMCPDVKPGGNSGRNDPYSEARKLCVRCPCIDECREYAVTLKPRVKIGMMAGMTPNQIRDEAWRRLREAKENGPTHI
jgi:hypothetical protein